MAIARALMQQPKVILADEPIASLDPMNAKVVMDSLQDINLRDGITVITNLHTLDTARTYCNRIVGMAAGKVVFDGAPEELTREAVRMVYGADTDGSEISEAITSTSISVAKPQEIRARQGARTRLRRLLTVRRRQRHSPDPPSAGRKPGHNRRDDKMFRNALYGAVALTALMVGAAQAEDLKDFRIGILGGENEADRLRSFQCLVDKLPAVLGVEKVSLFPAADYDGTIQGLLGGTLDYAELGASGYAKIYLENKDAVRADPDHRPDRRLDRLLFDHGRDQGFRHQDAGRPEGQETRLRRPGLDLGLPRPRHCPAEGSRRRAGEGIFRRNRFRRRA